MDSKKSKKVKVKAKKHSKKASPVDHYADLETRVAALEEIVRKQNPTSLPPVAAPEPGAAPDQVRNEVPA
jgi:hypothetical protein